MLTSYQYSELLIGTTIFIMAYTGYKYFSDKNNKYFYYDILITCLLFLLLMYFRYLLINYYILQSQKISSNILVDD
jgi:hypothetical protein